MYLNYHEEELFKLLNNIIKENGINTSIFVVGGWVRNKILNIPSNNDIDLVLDNITGKEFSKYFTTAKYIHEIKTNPDKSKNLETICIKIEIEDKIFDLDLCHFRKECYEKFNSRIPTIKKANINEDALRRDFTINSLYYNINKKTVIDVTGFGLCHIKSKYISTPIDPSITLFEDPLRGLRALRFHCQLNFNINTQIINVLSLKDYHDILNNKVSKERIGMEIVKMLKTSNYKKGIILMNNINLTECIFNKNMLITNDIIELFNELDKKNLANLENILALWLWDFYPQTKYILMDKLKLSKKISSKVDKLQKLGRNFQKFDDYTDIGICIQKSNDPYYKRKSIWIDSAIISNTYDKIYNCVEKQQLHNFWNMEPYFNGNELQKEFNLQPGKIIKGLINEQYCYRIKYPNCNIKEVTNHLKIYLENYYLL
ncbi:Poly A polymerase head domain [seawater metagenome]|uniref:Poly A polymerase head domain n=1 Tax=seawater metagenome TaxID=1561972 RepID=A0A5E8CGQ2_9ZZZZ